MKSDATIVFDPPWLVPGRFLDQQRRIASFCNGMHHRDIPWISVSSVSLRAQERSISGCQSRSSRPPLSNAESSNDCLADLHPGVLLLSGDQPAITDNEGFEQAALDIVRPSTSEVSSIRKGITFLPTALSEKSSSRFEKPVTVFPSTR